MCVRGKMGGREREGERESKCVCMLVCEREEENKCVCILVCVCVREREREREHVCVCVCVHVCLCVKFCAMMFKLTYMYCNSIILILYIPVYSMQYILCCTIGSLIFKGTASGIFQIYHGKSHDFLWNN